MNEMFSFSNIKLLLKVEQHQELKFELVSKRKLKCFVFFSLQKMQNIRLYLFIGLTKKAPMADIAHFLSSSEILEDKNRKIKDFSSGSSRNDNVLLHCLELTMLIGSSQVITQQDLTLLNLVFTVGTLRFLIGRSALPESQVQSASGSYLSHYISWVDHCICGQQMGRG